jgi:hypothetical protein
MYIQARTTEGQTMQDIMVYLGTFGGIILGFWVSMT